MTHPVFLIMLRNALILTKLVMEAKVPGRGGTFITELQTSRGNGNGELLI